MERYQRLYEAGKNTRNNSSARMNSLPLIHSFLNKRVRVKVDDGLTVEGVLIRYQNEDKTKHLPNVLVLKDGSSYRILRGNFENISEVAKHGV
jgi:hypothetical protein